MSNLTKEQIESNKTKFLSLLDRAAELKPDYKDGFEKLKENICKSDFFIAPAASKKEFHGCFEGGLCLHSLNVYNNLVKLVESHKEHCKDVSEYSMIVTALLHDLCKIGIYQKTIKGHYAKNPDGTTVQPKKWVEEEGYQKVSPNYEMGHAAKSIFMIQKFVPLTNKEAEAIYCHMGAFDVGEYFSRLDLANAFNHNVLAFCLHIADYEESYFDGKDLGNNEN